jgi:dipeptidyl aminopeptidase/acylaminoacyl peptidase
MNKQKLYTGAVLAGLFLSVFVSSAQDRLTAETLWHLGRVGEFQVSPNGQSVVYGITRYDISTNKGNTDLYLIPVAGGQPLQLTNFEGGEYNVCWRPDGKKIGFITSKSGSAQIWEMNPDGTGQKQISNIADGINGFAYSPTMQHVLYTKDVKLEKSATDIHTDLPLANAMIIDDLIYRHWNSWNDYAFSHIFIAKINADGTLSESYDIMKDEPFDTPMNPFGGMEQICWSPDGKKIAYTCKKLKGKEYAISTNSDIYLYDAISGTTSNISEGNMGYDQDPVFSPDGSKIVWKSMSTPGYESDKERMMLLDFNLNVKHDLTNSFDQNSSNFIWSKDSKTIYFISGIQATYQVYSISLADMTIKQLTTGDHDYTGISLAGNQIIGSRMSMSQPVELYRITADGSQEQLTFTNKDILSGLLLGAVEKRWIKTSDNKDMLVWVIYPAGFDKNRKYPALLYCQGGPQSAISQFWSYRWNFQMMAAHDYVIIAPNRRGLPTFGQAWNDEIAGDYGGQNMVDVLRAVDELSKEPFIDKNRLGAVGASYGAYQVYWLAGHHEKRFKAFIAHCGMFNLETEYASTEEYFFVNHDLGGAPWQNPKPVSYTFSPHLYVDKWDTPIMIITGQNDFRIPYTQSLQAFNTAQLLGVPSRLLYFPEESHFVLKPQNSILWQREFFKWLDTYLK